jgi:hypothetical protein
VAVTLAKFVAVFVEPVLMTKPALAGKATI